MRIALIGQTTCSKSTLFNQVQDTKQRQVTSGNNSHIYRKPGALTIDSASALSSTQMIVYATFVMFYLPCLATLSSLKRELGTRARLTIAVLTVVIALVSALPLHVVASIMQR